MNVKPWFKSYKPVILNIQNTDTSSLYTVRYALYGRLALLYFFLDLFVIFSIYNKQACFLNLQLFSNLLTFTQTRGPY